MKDKKSAILLDKMQSMKSVAEVAKMTDAKQDTINSITFAAPVYIAGMSSEPALSGAATAAQKGQFVNCIKGDAGVYAFQVLAKNKLEGKFDQKQEQAQQASANMRSINGFMQTLVRKAKIVDDRYKFYQ